MFEQYNVDRIFVPRTKQGEVEAKEDDEKDEKLTDEQKKAKEAADKAKADEAEQAMTKLGRRPASARRRRRGYREAAERGFDAAGMKIESPTVTLPNIRRTGLPPAHAAVFDLKPGEVSQVISDSGGHYIYKMDSKTEMTLDQAKNEIHGKIAERSHARKDGQAEQFIQGGDERGIFRTGWRRPDCPRPMPRPRPGMPPAGQRQGRRQHSHRRRKQQLMAKPVVVVTGVSGNLGSRLLPLLGSYSVIGVDVNPPQTDSELQFESLDLGAGILYPDVLRVIARYPRVLPSFIWRL